MFLVMGVQELPGIDEIFKAMNTIELRLIRDVANSLSRQVRHEADLMVDMFWQSGQSKITKATEMGEQTNTM